MVNQIVSEWGDGRNPCVREVLSDAYFWRNAEVFAPFLTVAFQPKRNLPGGRVSALLAARKQQIQFPILIVEHPEGIGGFFEHLAGQRD